jgi:hypothetical protein
MADDQQQLAGLNIPEKGVRIVVSIRGQYTLADHRNARGEPRTFACRAVGVSASEIALAAPVIGDIGERVLANLDHLGRIQGSVVRILSRGFVMGVAAGEEQRCRLNESIKWLDKHKNHDVREQRACSRFVPANPNSQLVLADGTTFTCLVIDLSATGARISADFEPEIGMMCAVGKIVSRVVRRFVDGFAVQFMVPPAREDIERIVSIGD